MDGTPAVTAIEPTINHDWGTGLITPSASDFVSARWYARIKAPLTEDFFFTVEADDGVRLYFDGVLKIDRWDTCWEDQIFTNYLEQGKFYDIKLEYKEEQGGARVKLYWSSLSIPKAIIPSTALYYPRYVGSSPYQITVSTGPSVASKSTASGAGLTSGIAGKISQFQIISRDFASAPIDNQNDNYAITLVNADGSLNGDLSFTAVYQGPTGIYISILRTYDGLNIYYVDNFAWCFYQWKSIYRNCHDRRHQPNGLDDHNLYTYKYWCWINLLLLNFC